MYIEIKDIKKLIDAGYTVIKAKWADKQQKIYLKKLQVGKGERTFFICPCCGSNANKLYLDKFGYKCIHCTSLKVYSGIQNTTKGGYSYIEYKMERYAKNNGIGTFDYPFDYMQHPKPKWKHYDKWDRDLAVLQALENMRMQSICFNKIWDTQTIRNVINGRNKFLALSLTKLKRYFYPFDKEIL